MKTAIISGASSGLGREYARLVPQIFPEIECIWLIARRTERLEDLRRELHGVDVRIVSLDLLSENSFSFYEKLLRMEDPNVSMLINCAGCGFLGQFRESNREEQLRTIALNNAALVSLTRLTVPYLEFGGRIINVSSIAAFVPTPGMAVYSASKAFVTAFGRALGEELREIGAVVTTVNPGPMNTEFLDNARIYGNSSTFESLPYCDPAVVAEQSLFASKRGKTAYTPRLLFKIYRVLACLIPHKLFVKFTKV